MKNYFKILNHRNDVLLNRGYNYSKTLLQNSISEEMYNTNNFFIGFLDKLNDVMVSMIDNVKRVKTTANIALEKDEINII